MDAVGPRGSASVLPEHHPARGHLVLRLPEPELLRGPLPRPREARGVVPGLHLLRVALPASRGGTDRALRHHRRPDAASRAHGGRIFAGTHALQLRSGEEDPARGPHGHHRRQRLRGGGGEPLHVRGVGGHRGVCLPDLLRLQRLLGHGDRPGEDAWLLLRGELQLALQEREHHRVLAALAHVALDLPARLPLHPAGWQPAGHRAHLCESHAHDGHRRPVARCVMERSSSGAPSTGRCSPSSG